MSLRIAGKVGGIVDARSVYNPSQDINNYYPEIIGHMARMLSDRSKWPGWIVQAMRAAQLSEGELARTFHDLVLASKMVRDDARQTSLAEAFERVGYQQRPWMARMIVMGMIGQMTIGGYFTARFEANELPILAGPPDGITEALGAIRKGGRGDGGD